MATSEAPVSRRRGGIRRHGQGWQARVSAGFDPSTGERIVLHETVPIPTARTKAAQERAERDSYKEAEKALTRLQAEADSLKVGRTKSTVGALLERWMAQHEIDPTTRMTYEAQIRLYIEPRLGDVPLVLFVREAAERLEPFTPISASAGRSATAGRSWSSPGAWCLGGDRVIFCSCQALSAGMSLVGTSLDALGLDQLQPDAVCPTAIEAETQPATANERADGAHR